MANGTTSDDLNDVFSANDAAEQNLGILPIPDIDDV